MFFSPNVRIFNSENASNALQRKQTTNTISRQPFLDKAVNFNKTPDVNSKLRQKQMPLMKAENFCKEQVMRDISTVSPSAKQKGVDNLKYIDFEYTNKEIEDTYDDILPTLTKKDVLKILRGCCAEVITPPPSPKLTKFHEMQVLHPSMDFIFDLPTSLSNEEFGTGLPANFQVDIPTLDDL